VKSKAWKNIKQTNYSRKAAIKLLLTVLVLVLTVPVFGGEKTFINRIFFEDFIGIGKTIAENPVQSLVIAGSTALAGGIIFANDRRIADEMKKSNAFNDFVFNNANYLGDGVFVMAANSFLFLGGQREKQAGQLVIESILVAGAVNVCLKAGIGRKRPSSAADPYQFTPFTFADLSMPSGHSLVAFSWATILGDTYDIGWLTYPVAGLVAWARVYKSAHWPSDVLAGGVIGVVTAKILRASRDMENENLSMEIRYSDSGTQCIGVNIAL
jgi:membrane-associated phospholipid phosphatase